MKNIKSVGGQSFPGMNRGNTVGNISNLGYIAIEGDWIYFNYWGEKNGLYKKRLTGGEVKKLSESAAEYINVINGWIYYSNLSDDRKIYRIRTDGTQQSKLNDDHSEYINVVSDQIFYCNYSDSLRPYSMSLEGKHRKVVGIINYDTALFLNAFDDWIYYSNDFGELGDIEDIEDEDLVQQKLEQGIHKIRPDGSGYKQINNDRPDYINVADGWVYYVNADQCETIFKTRTDGSDRIQLNDDRSSAINVAGEWIYYCNHSHGSRIYRMRLDGKEQTKLNDCFSLYIQLFGDWIYYYGIVGNYMEIYRMRTDGSGNELFN